MPAETYATREGDMIDLVCYRHYRGRQSGAVEMVLDANRHLRLSDYPGPLPRGLVLVLPEIAEPAPRTRALWD